MAEVEDEDEQHDVGHVSVYWQLDVQHGELHVHHDEHHGGLHDDHDGQDHHQEWSLQGLSQVKEQHYACYLFDCLVRTEHRTCHVPIYIATTLYSAVQQGYTD